MSYIFFILILLISVLLIIKNYRITKGFRLQKVVHVFSILFIFSTNITAFRNLFAIVKNYKTYSEWSNIYSNIDYLPDEIGLAISFISSLLGSALYAAAFGLLVRGNFSRKLIIWITPIKILFDLPLIHYLYYNHQSSIEQIITFWVVFLFLITYVGLFFMYRSRFMRSFFKAKENAHQHSNESLHL